MRNRVWIPENTSSSQETVNLPVGVEGYYYVDLIDKDTGQVKQHLEFKNVITDTGLNLMFIGNSGLTNDVFNWCGVGSGSSTPSTLQTNLDIPIGTRVNTGTSLSSSGSNANPEYHWIRINRRFTENQSNGLLSEVGFFSGSTGNNLTSRALFRDAAGNPTTITKTNQDLLDITYEFRLYAPTQDVTGTFEFRPGSSSVYTIRPQGVLQTFNWVVLVNRITDWIDTTNPVVGLSALATSSSFFNTRTGLNNPNGSEVTRAFLSPYTPNSFFRDVRFFWNDISANFDIAVVVFRFNYRSILDNEWTWQMSIVPPVQKVIDQRFDLILRLSINRV
jgi:hypothetical protein